MKHLALMTPYAQLVLPVVSTAAYTWDGQYRKAVYWLGASIITWSILK